MTSAPTIQEWSSDITVLRNQKRENLSLMSNTIQTHMRKIKQTFSLEVIKKAKKEIWDEIFPREAKIAFHPSNCYTIESKDPFEDNLFRFQGNSSSYQSHELLIHSHVV